MERGPGALDGIAHQVDQAQRCMRTAVSHLVAFGPNTSSNPMGHSPVSGARVPNTLTVLPVIVLSPRLLAVPEATEIPVLLFVTTFPSNVATVPVPAKT